MTNPRQREQTENALRKSEKLFAAFMDHLPGFAWVKDLEGRYLYVNKKEKELDAYRAGAIGKTDAELWPEEIASAYRANDRQVITTRKTVQTVEPSLADGEQSYMLVSKFPIFDRDGSVVMVGGVGVDITDRIRADEALKAQALRYKTLMETSTDSIYVVDEKGDLREANAAFLRRRGYTAAEVKGLNIADWDAQWSREQLQERMRKLVGSSAVFETRHRCKDGSVFDVEVCATSVRIGGEQLYFAVTRDITERKQAEEKLKQRESQLAEAQGLAHVGSWSLDLQSNTVTWSDELYRMFGVQPSEFDHSYEAVLGTTHPEDRDLLRSVIENALKTHEPFSAYYRMTRSNGEVRVLHAHGAVVTDEHGNAIRMHGAAQDVTERKQAEDQLRRSEEKFKALFGIAPVGISVLDRQHNVVDANPALEQITRLPKEELLNGAWRRRTYLNADGTPKPASELPSARAMAENRPLNDVETGIVTENGEIIWTQVSAAPLALPNASAVVITQDITERKRAAKELEEANHRLRILSRRLFEVQEEERRHLARELHDEIGQALTAAKINLQSITDNGDSSVLARLEETTSILDRLLGQVRQISLDLRPSMLDDLGLVPALRSLLDQQGRRASVAVRFSAESVPEKLDPEIQTTCFRIVQEAITNAVRHAAATHIDVDLQCVNGKLRLLIHDNGTGFNVESAHAQAIGLGLIGIKERAALVGGRAKVISSPNNGTTIEASLPTTLRSESQGRRIRK